MVGYIDTSDVDIAEVRKYWESRSAACFADSISVSTSTATSAASSSLVDASLFDGFNDDEPILLMSVSSDSNLRTAAPSPPFTVNLSPIPIVGRKEKKSPDINTSTHKSTTTRTAVQEWSELATNKSMDKTELLRKQTGHHTNTIGTSRGQATLKKYKEAKKNTSRAQKDRANDDRAIMPCIDVDTHTDISDISCREEPKENHCDMQQQSRSNNVPIQQRSSEGVAVRECSSSGNGTSAAFSYPRLFQRVQRHVGKSQGKPLSGRVIADI